MTNEEEKILEEILEEGNDITLEEAAEEAEELQEETQDEGRAIEIPIERREDADLEEILERQVLRGGGLRDVGHPEMIQTHLDNFLAKIAGETPIDDNTHNSTEFWLNEIAKNQGGGGKKYYLHNFCGDTIEGAYLSFTIITDDATPLTTYNALKTMLDKYGFKDYFNDSPRYQVLPCVGFYSTNAIVMGILIGYDVDRIEFYGRSWSGGNYNFSIYITDSTSFATSRDVVTEI